MKKLFALLLAAVLLPCMALAADVDYTGTWVLSGAKYNGFPINPATFGLDMTVVLNADGTCSIVGAGDQALGSWEEIDGGIVASAAGKTLTLRLRNGKLVSDAVDGITLTFSRGVSAPRVPGDADNSGSVNEKDALTVLEFAAGNVIVINLSNANVNGDYSLNGQDALLILQHSAGWDVTLQ